MVPQMIIFPKSIDSTMFILFILSLCGTTLALYGCRVTDIKIVCYESGRII